MFDEVIQQVKINLDRNSYISKPPCCKDSPNPSPRYCSTQFQKYGLTSRQQRPILSPCYCRNCPVHSPCCGRCFWWGEQRKWTGRLCSQSDHRPPGQPSRSEWTEITQNYITIWVIWIIHNKASTVGKPPNPENSCVFFCFFFVLFFASTSHPELCILSPNNLSVAKDRV